MRPMPIALALLAAAAPALAQPLPSGPAVNPAIKVSPGVTLSLPFNPQMELVGDVDAYRLGSFRLKVSGLGPAKAIHLYELRPGCRFEQQPGVAGLALKRTFDQTYSTDLAPFPKAYEPEGAGLPVAADGTVSIPLQGVAPAMGGAVLDNGRTIAQMQEAGFLATTIRTGAPIDSCAPAAIVAYKGADGVWRLKGRDGAIHPASDRSIEPATTVGRAWTPMPRRHVVVEDTNTLKALLDPFMNEGAAGSVCSGRSEAFGQPSYAVGVRESGGDIVFRIRSGPAGTRCFVGLPSVGLPAGTAVKAKFSVSKTGDKCKVENGLLPQDYLLYLFPHPPSFGLSRVQSVLAPSVTVDSDGGTFDISATGWLDPWTFPEQGSNSRFSWQSHTAPVGAAMLCQATGVNDHGVELRLDRVEFDLPYGVSLPTG